MELLQLFQILLVSLVSVSNGAPSRICKIDLAFVIDSSVSIPKSDFNKQIQFVNDIVDFLNVGPDSTKVAAVSFSNYLYPEFGFDDNPTKADVLKAINSIDHSQGDATRTYLALQHTHEQIFAPGSGERPDVIDVVVVLTDGETNPGSYDNHWQQSGKAETQNQANAIKARPAYIFAIGVGDEVDKAELNGISSDPDARFSIMVDSFTDLNTDDIKDMLFRRACKEIIPEPTDIPIPNPPCKETVADIFFVLDQSSSIKTQKNFKKELDFVTNVVDYLEIRPGQVQVGVMKFSTNPTIEFDLNTYSNKNEVAERVNQISWKGGDTYLEKALRLVRTQGMTPSHGSRGADGIPQIVVLITDGQSTKPDLTEAELVNFHGQNYITFAIGVGPKKDPAELAKIASDPSHVFQVDDLDGLLAIRQALLTRLCTASYIANELRKESKVIQKP